MNKPNRLVVVFDMSTVRVGEWRNMRYIVFVCVGVVVFCSQVFPQEPAQGRPPAALEPGKIELVAPVKTTTPAETPGPAVLPARRGNAAAARRSASPAPPSREGDPRELFARANRLYEAGNYEEARGAYDALVRKGYRGGNLYYNLGNTHFKLDDKGKAILFYKKARKLKPRDQDIASNLEYALSLIEDKIEPRPRSWLVQVWSRAVGYFTIGELTDSAAGVYWLLCAALIIFIYARPWRAILSRITGALLLVLVVVVSAAFSRAWLEGQEEAVVISKEAKVRYGPSGNDVAAFVLHEGVVVEIENRKGDWYQVSLPDGKAGWLEKGSCGII